MIRRRTVLRVQSGPHVEKSAKKQNKKKKHLRHFFYLCGSQISVCCKIAIYVASHTHYTLTPSSSCWSLSILSLVGGSLIHPLVVWKIRPPPILLLYLVDTHTPKLISAQKKHIRCATHRPRSLNLNSHRCLRALAVLHLICHVETDFSASAVSCCSSCLTC